MKPFLQELIKVNFPSQHVVHAFGYGSAVFKQANYNVKTPDQVIDVILVVDDTDQFHQENLSRNYKHYSAFPKRLPLTVTSNAVQRSGSRLYFNPLIPLNTFQNLQDDMRKLKYGVIHKQDALDDLNNWTKFALAGRMQKPILTLIEDPEIKQAEINNLKSAMSLALILHFDKVDQVNMLELLTTLCNFSYKGDIRMRWKMENPNKVKNIVLGQLEGLNDLYLPFMRELQDRNVVQLVKSEDHQLPDVKIFHKKDNLQLLFDKVPHNIKYNMKDSVL
jgi:mitochondrial translocator assembly and maintenance protein 41